MLNILLAFHARKLELTVEAATAAAAATAKAAAHVAAAGAGHLHTPAVAPIQLADGVLSVARVGYHGSGRRGGAEARGAGWAVKRRRRGVARCVRCEVQRPNVNGGQVCDSMTAWRHSCGRAISPNACRRAGAPAREETMAAGEVKCETSATRSETSVAEWRRRSHGW